MPKAKLSGSMAVPDWLNSELWRKKDTERLSVSEPTERMSFENTERTSDNLGAASRLSTSDQNSALNNSSDKKIQSQSSKESEFVAKPAAEVGEKTSSQLVAEQKVGKSGSDNSDPASSSSETAVKSSTAMNAWIDDKRIAIEKRIARIYSELGEQVINLRELRKSVTLGLPSEGNLRSTCWRLLLGYLPPELDSWEENLFRQRLQYEQFKTELILDPSELSQRNAASPPPPRRVCRFDDVMDERNGAWTELSGESVADADHPLSQGMGSAWNQYFKDAEIAEQIERDVMRTHPDNPFFSGESGQARETQEAMKRILLLYAKLNPGICYVQGMNEVLAPLYFVFRTSPDPESWAHAEADSFFCFSALMADLRDNYCKQLDHSMVGIRSTIAAMADLLRTHDNQLWRHMEYVAKVTPPLYSFRWISLLLTQDFEFGVVLRLWDSLLANPEGPMELLLRVCCAMLVVVRDKLLAGDFATNVKLLQHYPCSDVDRLLKVADRLRSK